MTAAGFAQKIILPFHLSYLLIFLSQYLTSAFYDILIRKNSVVEISSEEIIGFPGLFVYFFVYSRNKCQELILASQLAQW